MEQVLPPLPLDEGPEGLDGVEGAGVGRETDLVEAPVVDFLDGFGMVDPQVVLHHRNLATPLALVLQANKEVTDPVCVIAIIEDFIVDEPSVETDRSNYSY